MCVALQVLLAEWHDLIVVVKRNRSMDSSPKEMRTILREGTVQRCFVRSNVLTLQRCDSAPPLPGLAASQH